MAFGATQQMLDEARAAYIRIATGGGVYEFRDQNGEVVRYARTDLNKLYALIQMLETELDLSTAPPPMQVWL